MDIPPNILIVGGGVFGRKLFSPTTITHNSTPENQTPITPAPLIRISNDSFPPPPFPDLHKSHRLDCEYSH